MTGQLIIQSSKGRETIEWDTTQNGGGKLDPVHAQEAFEHAMAHGGQFAVAEKGKGSGLEQIKKFDPETQSRVVVTPQISGG